MTASFLALALIVVNTICVASAHAPRYANIITSRDELYSTYDFVIVGGGASGLTVADRLTEDPQTTVLVLEYGPFDHHEDPVLVPGLLNLTSTPYWFNLTSTPQIHLNNRSFKVTIASAVGGGTVINGMFFQRGVRADYDAWDELGAKGWSWNDLLPYFKKSETFTPPSRDYAEEWGITYDVATRGSDGPIQASYPPYQFPVIKNFFRAFHDLGITTPSDPSDGSSTGAMWVTSTLDPVSRTRSYARIVHYDRVIETRPNYHVLPMSAVTKILFDKQKQATGVEYISRETNDIFTVAAKKEVVLAAGAVHTPQILMLSGIGSKTELGKQGIECVSDLPGVGHNFQDHPTLFFVNEFQNDLTPNVGDLTTNITFRTEELSKYRAHREGAFTLVALGGNTAAFIPLPHFTTPNTTSALLRSAQSEDPHTIWPNVPSTVRRGYVKQRAVLLREFATSNLPLLETGFNSAFIPLTLLHPLSRGRISINSTSYLAPPLVDYSTLSSPTDLAVLIEMLRFNRRLLRTPSLAELSPVENVPGANVTSDEDLRDALRGLVGPTYQHPCCTCPMVRREDGGVVDPVSLGVYGVRGLSVVDASLMPVVPGAHLMPAVYGVAEKAADLIKARHDML